MSALMKMKFHAEPFEPSVAPAPKPRSPKERIALQCLLNSRMNERIAQLEEAAAALKFQDRNDAARILTKQADRLRVLMK